MHAVRIFKLACLFHFSCWKQRFLFSYNVTTFENIKLLEGTARYACVLLAPAFVRIFYITFLGFFLWYSVVTQVSFKLQNETIKPHLKSLNLFILKYNFQLKKKKVQKISKYLQNKFPIRETLNLLTCADSRTNTKTDRKGEEEEKNVSCQVSGVQYQMLSVNCHLSPVMNANSHSHRPPPCLLPHYAQQANLQKIKKKPHKILNSKIH